VYGAICRRRRRRRPRLANVLALRDRGFGLAVPAGQMRPAGTRPGPRARAGQDSRCRWYRAGEGSQRQPRPLPGSRGTAACPAFLMRAGGRSAEMAATRSSDPLRSSRHRCPRPPSAPHSIRPAHHGHLIGRSSPSSRSAMRHERPTQYCPSTRPASPTSPAPGSGRVDAQAR